MQMTLEGLYSLEAPLISVP